MLLAIPSSIFRNDPSIQSLFVHCTDGETDFQTKELLLRS